MKEKTAVIYQFVLLVALIAFDAYVLYTTGALEETVTGALIGLAVGVGLNTVQE